MKIRNLSFIYWMLLAGCQPRDTTPTPQADPDINQNAPSSAPAPTNHADNQPKP